MSFTCLRIASVVVAVVGLLVQSSCSMLKPTHYSIQGAVARPGEYRSYKPLTVEEAIKKAGGLKANADLARIDWRAGYVGVVTDYESIRTMPLQQGMEIVVSD